MVCVYHGMSPMVFVIVCVCDCVFLSLCSSYLHCRWADLEELEKDKRIHQKVKRFRAKQALPTFVTEVSPTVLSSHFQLQRIQ